MEIIVNEKEKEKDIEKYKSFINNLKVLIKNKLYKFQIIESIVLFGSYATLEYNDQSDIDLCIFYKEKPQQEITNPIEKKIFNKILDVEEQLSKSIQCVFIKPNQISSFDEIFLENILAEGKLLYGSLSYRKLIQSKLELESYLLIEFSLNNLSQSDKMKFKRAIYGYSTKKTYKNKTYEYDKKGLIQKLNGKSLSKGIFMIPEKKLFKIKHYFDQFDIKYTKERVWINKVI
jgi:predicted nucleotidyltransferase